MTEKHHAGNYAISVAIVTLNEEDRISACLSSLGFADEIVVVDCGSRDCTTEIARSFGCRVLFNPWPGFAAQKQFAVNHCKNDWVLILDADEKIPEQTAALLPEKLNAFGKDYAAFSLLRKNCFHDRWIKRCGWWPDRIVRLVNRKKGQFSSRMVHEGWETDGPVLALDEVFEHFSFRNYSDLIEKMQNYSSLSAEEMFLEGKTCGWSASVTHGTWMFIRSYLLELGILEGFDGFMISLLHAQGSFMKYAKLYEKLKMET